MLSKLDFTAQSMLSCGETKAVDRHAIPPLRGKLGADLKITLVTAVLDRSDTIGEAMDSVAGQSYRDIEHIVQDGGSRDGTREVVEEKATPATRFVTEPDRGIYDALNKGFARATGDVVGLLHSDDVFAHQGVLGRVAGAFADRNVDAVYGDLQYVARNDTRRVIRHWRAGAFSPDLLLRGWMPPHPTLFLRREVLERWGGFDTSYRIAGDYDAILRYFGRGGITAAYIPEVLVKMRVGGESNRSLRRVLLKSREDYRALRTHGVGGVSTLLRKNTSKISQFFVRDVAGAAASGH